MSLIKVKGLSHVRYSAPDLDRMRAFLLDFGMLDGEPFDDGALRMRGGGETPFIHETVLGEPGFAGLALEAADVRDVYVLADSENLEVLDYAKPGGGKVVSLTDPNGFKIDVIAGQAAIAPISSNPSAWNTASRRLRVDVPKALAAGPSRVMRLGHVVLRVNNLPDTYAWWTERFGLLMSDKVVTADGTFEIAFLRCDRGDEAVDHHTVCLGATDGMPGIHHCAFEVLDFDDLMTGKDYLAQAGHQHRWGIGRHILGGQVFDYWADPWGNYIEHWTDGDVFTDSKPTQVADLDTAMGVQWGPATPPKDF